MAEVAEVSVKTTKPRQVENIYIDSKGNRAARPQPDVVAIGKKFLETGYEVIKQLSTLSNESLSQAAAFGLQQVAQNAYGAATSEDERISMCEDRWDSIWNGNWSSERQVGPRTADLVEAFALAKADKDGEPVTDEWKASIQAKLDSGEITTKSLSDNPLIKAKHDAIKAARAAERAKKSLDAARATAELPDFA